jgi:hypothetical protein
LAKEINFTSLMPQGHAAAPKNKLRGMSKGSALATKKPGKCRAFQFS